LDQRAVGVRRLAYNIAGKNGSVAHVKGVELGEGDGNEATP
jgi:hypothetical protein